MGLLIAFLSLCISNIVFSKTLVEDSIKLAKGSRFKSEYIGFMLQDLDSGEIIGEHNADSLFVPASLMKIPSTYMALETLGADHRFKTHLKYNGSISKGTLKGDLILIGEGDPFLTSSDLLSMAHRLKLLGVKKLEGNFYFQDKYLPNTHILNKEVPEDHTYNPGISALSVDFNRFTLWQYGRRRSTYKNTFATVPMLSSFVVAKTNEKLGPITKFRPIVSQQKEIWTISLKERYRKSTDLPVRFPALYAAGLLQKFAKFEGIELPDPKLSKNSSSSYKTVTTIKSKPLIQLVESTLEYSNNLLAELILLGALKKSQGNLGKFSSSGDLLKSWLTKYVPESSWENVKIANGSGLDYRAAMSAKNLLTVLKKAEKKFYGPRSYWSLLSASGHKGWLDRRLKEPEYSYRLWGKTGSLDYVSNIAGYFVSKSNRRIVFSLLINDKKKRAKINELPMNKSRSLRRRAVPWNRKAQSLQDYILKMWIDKL